MICFNGEATFVAIIPFLILFCSEDVSVYLILVSCRAKNRQDQTREKIEMNAKAMETRQKRTSGLKTQIGNYEYVLCAMCFVCRYVWSVYVYFKYNTRLRCTETRFPVTRRSCSSCGRRRQSGKQRSVVLYNCYLPPLSLFFICIGRMYVCLAFPHSGCPHILYILDCKCHRGAGKGTDWTPRSQRISQWYRLSRFCC